MCSSDLATKVMPQQCRIFPRNIRAPWQITKLERALEEIADIHPAFTLDRETVLGSLSRSVASLEENLVRQG